MDTASLPFLFLFLPIFALAYLISKKEMRLYIIAIASVVFLAWGQPGALLWIGLILLVSYALGNFLPQAKAKKNAAWLWLGLGLNLGILSLFKYWTAYGSALLASNRMPGQWVPSLTGLAVPLGLSYVTFQAISYLVDVWKGTIPPEKNIACFSAYLLFFPKLVSGPLMRYKSFADQINDLNPSFEIVADGIRRLFIGFIKRALIANRVALVANSVFNLPQPNVAPQFAWLGLIAYTVQIYFDFSGYTDMAIGLGLMAGIRLPENFNFPYMAQSIGDFWRRWHISLMAWFREYVFYPLERRRFKWAGQQINFILVFLLTGLWHGFKLTFIAWGLMYGIVLAVESLGFGRWLSRAWRPLRHVYVLTIVMVGWVFFRSNGLRFAFGFFLRLLGDSSGVTLLPFSVTSPLPFIEPSIILSLAAGIIFSFPLTAYFSQKRSEMEKARPKAYLAFQLAQDFLLIALFILGLAANLGQSFLPNIYASF